MVKVLVHLLEGDYSSDACLKKGLLAVGYEKFGDPILLEKDPIRHLYEVYVRVHEESRNNPEIDALADDYFRRMEEGEQAKCLDIICCK